MQVIRSDSDAVCRQEVVDRLLNLFIRRELYFPCCEAPSRFWSSDREMNPDEEAYHNLCYYTLPHGHPSFIHQHVVDAFAAQDAKEGDKPIRLTFALVGLYLHVEQGFTGRQVQLAHMKLGRKKRQWPAFRIPDDRGAMNAANALAASPGAERDQVIHDWAACVWRAFSDNRQTIESLLKEYGIS